MHIVNENNGSGDVNEIYERRPKGDNKISVIYVLTIIILLQ